MILSRYISVRDYKKTIKLATEIRKRDGLHDYYFFKKMALIGAYRCYVSSYLYMSYDEFIFSCKQRFDKGMRIEDAFNLRERYRESFRSKKYFYGVDVAYLFEKSILEINNFLDKKITEYEHSIVY